MEDLPLGLGTGKAFCGIGGSMFDLLGINKEERKEFLSALIGAVAVMGCVYIIAWVSYIFAPSYYGW